MQGFFPHLGTFTRIKLAVFAGGSAVFLLTLGWFNPLGILFKASREISYTETMHVMHCKRDDDCVTQYELIIGNTGRNDLPQVEVVIHDLPASMKDGWSNASAITAGDFENHGVRLIEQKNDAGARSYLLQDFRAGTLLKMVWVDYSMPKQVAMQLAAREKFAEIHSSARLVRSHPHMTVIGRLIEALSIW